MAVYGSTIIEIFACRSSTIDISPTFTLGLYMCIPEMKDKLASVELLLDQISNRQDVLILLHPTVSSHVSRRQLQVTLDKLSHTFCKAG
jgi:hypothetical protein